MDFDTCEPSMKDVESFVSMVSDRINFLYSINMI